MKKAWHKSDARAKWEHELKNYWSWKLRHRDINAIAKREGQDPYELLSYFMEIDVVFGMTKWKPEYTKNTKMFSGVSYKEIESKLA
jgi:hypothetical protein